MATSLSTPRSGSEVAEAPALRARGLTKRYGRVRALDGLDLEIPRGSLYGLIGPNGAGKTTTLGLVSGWLHPTAGTVEVLGGVPGEAARLRGRLAALPQDATLPPAVPVRETLVFYARLQGMGPARARTEADRVLGVVGMEGRAAARAGTLSHGMAKRVSLAQALLGSPELILLDEPTAGLDPAHAHRLRELIRSLRGVATVVISSHNLHELESLCDGAAILREGRLAAAGTMAELTASDRDVVVDLANPPAEIAVLAETVRGLGAVSEVQVDRGDRLVVRIEADEEDPPEVLVSEVLRVLLQGGALIGRVERGRGLEGKVLSLG